MAWPNRAQSRVLRNEERFLDRQAGLMNALAKVERLYFLLPEARPELVAIVADVRRAIETGQRAIEAYESWLEDQHVPGLQRAPSLLGPKAGHLGQLGLFQTTPEPLTAAV